MQQFERDFATPEQPVKLIKLEQNYRSHGHILDAANALIRHNQVRLGKNLWTSEGKGEPVRAFAAPTDHDEAAFVVDVVRGMSDEGVRARRDGAALSLERAVARARARALRRRHSVSRLRRHALLRARRGQARARVPAPHRGARRRRRVPARRELSAARHRRAHARAAAGDRAGAGRDAVAGRRSRARLGGQGGRRARDVRAADRAASPRDARAAAARGGRARDREVRARSRTTAPRRTGRIASTTWPSSSPPPTASCARRELATDAPMLSERVAPERRVARSRARTRARPIR